MNLRKKYKQLFEGRIRSNDNILLSEDLRSDEALIHSVENIYNGASDGQDMTDDIIDDLGDFYDKVQDSNDEELIDAYSELRDQADNKGGQENAAAALLDLLDVEEIEEIEYKPLTLRKPSIEATDTKGAYFKRYAKHVISQSEWAKPREKLNPGILKKYFPNSLNDHNEAIKRIEAYKIALEPYKNRANPYKEYIPKLQKSVHGQGNLNFQINGTVYSLQGAEFYDSTKTPDPALDPNVMFVFINTPVIPRNGDRSRSGDDLLASFITTPKAFVKDVKNLPLVKPLS